MEGFGEKLKKSSPICPPQRAGNHKQHSSSGTMTTPDALWEVEWSLAVAAAEATFFITTTQGTKGAKRDLHRACCAGSTD